MQQVTDSCRLQYTNGKLGDFVNMLTADSVIIATHLVNIFAQYYDLIDVTLSFTGAILLFLYKSFLCITC